MWYTNEITTKLRAGLKASHELWCDELERRFRMPPGNALKELRSLKYGIEQFRARQDPEAFVRKAILYGTASNTAPAVYEQLLLAHQLLDGRLRIHITVLTETTMLTSLFRSLSSIKSTWKSRNCQNSGHRERDSRRDLQQVFNIEVNCDLDDVEHLGYDEPADKCAYEDAYLQGMENETEDEGSEIEANEIDVVGHYLVVPRKHDIQPNAGRPRLSSKPQPQNKVPPGSQEQPSPTSSHFCQICKQTFISNNRLHLHLRNLHPNHRAILRNREQNKKLAVPEIPVPESKKSTDHHIILST
ncbi:hypothetical protein K3495_g5820 [Podosphaera aphanis]|nr:hypothetical protein K3495_g5820 [Podosphaera aphanis]